MHKVNNHTKSTVIVEYWETYKKICFNKWREFETDCNSISEDDSIFNHIHSFIDSEAIEKNVIPQFLMYQQKSFYGTDTFYVNEK